MSKFSDPMYLRIWEYTATSISGQRSGPYEINENITGARLGHQKPARLTFRTALWIIHGWNQLGDMKYRLVIPLLKE